MSLLDVTVKKNPVTVTIKSISWQQLIPVKQITIQHIRKNGWSQIIDQASGVLYVDFKSTAIYIGKKKKTPVRMNNTEKVQRERTTYLKGHFLKKFPFCQM